MLRYTSIATTSAGATQELFASCTFSGSTSASCVTRLTAMGTGTAAPATSTMFSTTYDESGINAAQATVTAGAEKLILPPSCDSPMSTMTTSAQAGGGSGAEAGMLGAIGGLLAMLLF